VYVGVFVLMPGRGRVLMELWIMSFRFWFASCRIIDDRAAAREVGVVADGAAVHVVVPVAAVPFKNRGLGALGAVHDQPPALAGLVTDL